MGKKRDSLTSMEWNQPQMTSGKCTPGSKRWVKSQFSVHELMLESLALLSVHSCIIPGQFFGSVWIYTSVRSLGDPQAEHSTGEHCVDLWCFLQCLESPEWWLDCDPAIHARPHTHAHCFSAPRNRTKVIPYLQVIFGCALELPA